MSVKYNNFKNKLKEHNIVVETTLTDFEKNLAKDSAGCLTMKCENNHIFDLKCTSLKNLLLAIKKNPSKKVCSKCTKDNFESIEGKKSKEKCEKLGFIFISYDLADRRIEYECVCGNITSTKASNMLREDRTSQCPKCQNDTNKSNVEDIKKEFEANNCELINYENNKNIDYKCSCGNISNITMLAFRKGGRCNACKLQRTTTTNEKIYGCKNVFQNEDIKQKSRETCTEKYGVEYIMQNPEFKAKSEETCMKRYGRKWQFTAPEVYEKIRATHLKNHGVEYPLQSKEIQEKISNIFQDKYGASRPFMSAKFWNDWSERLMKSHGVKFHTQIQEWKDKVMATSLERYGSKYYIISNTFRQKMIAEYGVEHAMHSYELFRKAIKSMYSSKPYTMPSGIIVNIMGYEWKALNILLGIDIAEGRNIDLCIESEICLDEIPVIPYIDENGKSRIYYPDILIQKEKILIIEVKSLYTYNMCNKRNHQKFIATSCLYDMDVWIFDEKKRLVKILNYRDGIGMDGDAIFKGSKFIMKTRKNIDLDIDDISDIVREEFEQLD